MFRRQVLLRNAAHRSLPRILKTIRPTIVQQGQSKCLLGGLGLHEPGNAHHDDLQTGEQAVQRGGVHEAIRQARNGGAHGRADARIQRGQAALRGGLQPRRGHVTRDGERGGKEQRVRAAVEHGGDEEP